MLINTSHLRAASLPRLTESRQSIQMGPKQSLLPNSTETPFATRGWEALPRTVSRGASSQRPGHRVMGTWDLSGDDRRWGKVPGERTCIGVREDTPESDTISKSRERHFRKGRLRIHWEYDLTWERAMPDLCSFIFLLFWASPSGNVNLQGISKRWKTWCSVLRVNTPPSRAPTLHTGKPSLWGTDSPLCPLSEEGLRTVNSRTETNTGLSHTCPWITLPASWGLTHTAAGGTSTHPTIPLRSHSRPWSSPTQSRAPSPPPGPDLSLKSGG